MVGKKKKGRKRVVFAVVVLIAIGGAVLHFVNRGEAPLQVQVETVGRRDVTEVVLANGRIHPVVQVVINPEVSGEIVELPVREGQKVEKGDLLVRIKPDNYIASRRSAEAAYRAALAAVDSARANAEKAELEFNRSEQLHARSIISESDILEVRTILATARASLESSTHQGAQAKAALDRADDDLAKTTITAPISGTITKLSSQVGERVVGSITMAGTEIMTLADLEVMEARVDIGEIDIVLLQAGQKARLEVDAFRDRKFTGLVTDIANSAATPAQGQQQATRFEVRIRLEEQEAFRPGMSVMAEVETRYREDVLTVPIQSVTTRLPLGSKKTEPDPADSQAASGQPQRPIEVVFLADGGKARMVPVKRGISDDAFVELVEGVTEGNRVISGNHRAINRDLENGRIIAVE